MNCAACQRALVSDEIAITRKMVNRGTEVFYCTDCLAAMFRITPDDVRTLIERFRKAGCSLF